MPKKSPSAPTSAPTSAPSNNTPGRHIRLTDQEWADMDLVARAESRTRANWLRNQIKLALRKLSNASAADKKR